MSNKFEPGAVVTLNSGGQQMTVESYVADAPSKAVVCVWTDKGKPYREVYLEVALTAADDGPMPFSVGLGP